MELFLELCNLSGISGNENAVRKFVSNKFIELCNNVYTDNNGNLFAKIKKGNSNIKILIEAHIDEIGLMVKNISDDSKISFAEVGGINTETLPYSEVMIFGKENIPGIIGVNKNIEKAYKTEDLFIETGYSKDYIDKIISVGDFIGFTSDGVALKSGKIAAKAIDNRMGIYTLIQSLKQLKDVNFDAEITFLAAVQEEVGLRGAKTAANEINPDYAIVVDVTHGISPYVKNTDGAFPLGEGPTIALGPNFDKELNKRVINYVEKNDIPHNIEVCESHSGTDAWEIQTVGAGVKCVLISPPLRYMHTQNEVIDFIDIENTIKIIVGIIEEGILC